MKTSVFEFSHVSDLLRDLKPTDWIIDGLVEAEALSVLFGESGSYKTFLALSWGLSIASGTDWFGHKVKQGSVFFIIGEGQNGFARRIKAWELKTKINLSEMPFYVSRTPVMMLDDESVKAAGHAINALRDKHGKPALVVVDTLARNFGPGDENRTEDMTKFISNLDKYIGRDCSRMVVHHTGQGNKERARGSYALIAAVDAEYCMSKKEDSVVLSCTKMKDGEKFSNMAFKPRTIDLNEALLPMTSVYLDWIEVQVEEVKLSPQMREAISLLRLMTKDGTKNCHTCLCDWRELCVDEKVYARTAFYAATKNLEDKKVIRITSDYVELSQVS